MSHDRRKTERRQVQAYAALETIGRFPNDQAFSAVFDVSRSGIGVKTGQPPTNGQTVYLRLAMGETIHTLRTTATRVQKREGCWYDVGLDWSNCKKEELAFLDEFLAALPRSD
jgi:hypothetical protein